MRENVISSALASYGFRLVAIPLIAAGLGCYLRYKTARAKQRDINWEIFVIWPELIIVSVFNLLIFASDVAIEARTVSSVYRHMYDEALLESAVGMLAIMFLLLILSDTVAISRPEGSRRIFFEFIVPHIVAFSVLEGVLLLASRPMP